MEFYTCYDSHVDSFIYTLFSNFGAIIEDELEGCDMWGEGGVRGGKHV